MSEVNHPSHYNIPGKKECIDMMREEFGDRNTAIFCLMNSYKYLYRMGNKEGEPAVTDLSKAWWYYNYVVEHLFSDVTGHKLIKLYKSVEVLLHKKGAKNE